MRSKAQLANRSRVSPNTDGETNYKNPTPTPAMGEKVDRLRCVLTRREKLPLICEKLFGVRRGFRLYLRAPRRALFEVGSAGDTSQRLRCDSGEAPADAISAGGRPC